MEFTTEDPQHYGTLFHWGLCSDFKKTMSFLHLAELKVLLQEAQLTQNKTGLKT